MKPALLDRNHCTRLQRTAFLPSSRSDHSHWNRDAHLFGADGIGPEFSGRKCFVVNEGDCAAAGPTVRGPKPALRQIEANTVRTKICNTSRSSEES